MSSTCRYSGPLFWELPQSAFCRVVTGERPLVEVERILTAVLFTDVVGSTERAAAFGDQRWSAVLDERLGRPESAAPVRRPRGEHDRRRIGRLVDGPARAVRCAQAIMEATARIGVELRVGLHTGECEVRGTDLGGLSVHIAARVASQPGSGEILVSGTVKDLVIGSGIEFTDHGGHELKGVPGNWKLFAIAR
jgi:class 3 adenylate cyclase